MTLLTIMSDPKAFAKVVPFLAAQNISTTFAHNLPEAIQKIQKNQFDVILLSWTLPCIDIPKTYEYFDQRLNSLVIVFAETDDTKIVKKLMASRIDKTMFPPLYGPTVIKRIDQLRVQAGMIVDRPPDTGITAVSASAVPADIEWEATQGAQYGTEKMWQGVSAADETATYLYQGAEAPNWNAQNKIWMDPRKPYLKVTGEARNRMGGVLGGPIRRKSKLTVIGVEDRGNLYSFPQVHQEDGSALFFESLSNATRTINANLVNPVLCEDEIGKVTLSWVRTPPMAGLIVAGDASSVSESALLLKAVQAELRAAALLRKCDFDLLIARSDVEIPETNSHLWAARQTKYVYGVKSARARLVMAYVRLQKGLQIDLNISTEYIALNLDETLRIGAKIPIDVFIYMKRNNRFIRFIAANNMFTEGAQAKLQKSEITQVMIRRKDLESFLAYKSKYYLGLTK